jgi:hypothetical protein
MIKELKRKIKNGYKYLKKKLHHFVIPYSKEKSLLFIVGCQRSGTTMISKLFNEDLNTNNYGEYSKLSSLDKIGKIRLNPLHLVYQEIKKDKAPFTILKPLVESQNTNILLDYFSESKALWVYRDFKDVASSNLIKFGIQNGIKNLRPIVNDDKNNWRSENVTEDERKLICRFFSEEMNPYDAAVLFWILRNNIYFKQKMDKNPRVLICKYEHFIKYPDKVLKDIYGSLNQIFPGDNITKSIHSKSVHKGKDLDISDEIEQLAIDLLNKLDHSFCEKNPQYASELYSLDNIQ